MDRAREAIKGSPSVPVNVLTRTVKARPLTPRSEKASLRVSELGIDIADVGQSVSPREGCMGGSIGGGRMRNVESRNEGIERVETTSNNEWRARIFAWCSYSRGRSGSFGDHLRRKCDVGLRLSVSMRSGS